MASPSEFEILMGALDEQIDDRIPPPPPPPPARPPGGAYDGGMEARVEKLEEFAKNTGERLARVETKLDHVEKEVGQIKWWIVAQIVAGLLAVLGTGITIQQMTVSTFQAAGQQANPPAPAPPPIIINVPSAPAPAPAAPASR